MSYWDNFRPEGDGPTYLAIFRAMAQAIERGDLQPGRRLPSHRLLAERLGVAVGTVTRAYNEALDHGLIRGQIGRGSFVREHHPAMHLSVVDQSRIPAGTIDLYQNFPVAFPEVENQLWSEALGTLRRQNDLATMMRASWSEESAQRQHAGVVWIERTGLKPEQHNVFDCPGVQSALCAILGAVTKPGDLVAAPSLSHPGIKLLADQYSLKIRGLPIDQHHLDPEAFETICRESPPKILYCSPTIHPPTAITMPEQRRRAVAEIAQRYDVIIVEDESAAFLLAEPPLPIAAFAPERSFFVADVWMALSLSLRTTFVLTPNPFMNAMATAVAATSGVTPPLVAEIASLWIESDTADRLIELRRAELLARNDLVRKILGHREVRNDACGHHIWLELPRPWPSENFALRAERRGVAINGAEWFAIGHGPIPEAVRVCIGNAPDRQVLHWALETLDRLIDEPKSTSRPVF